MAPLPVSEDRIPLAEPGRFGTDVAVRTRSALILGLTVLALTAIGGWAFSLFAALLAALILREWLMLTGWRRDVLIPYDLPALAALVVVSFAAFGFMPALICAVILLAAVMTASPREAKGTGSRLWAGCGVIYATLPPIALISLRTSPNYGLWAVVFLYAVVWTTDIAAFFIGRAVGGPRLMPAVSPKKTWSGAVGGLFGALIAALVVGLLARLPSLAPVLTLAAVTSVVAQAGDLFESWIKRCFLVKDSGRLIPGHGGVMDRVDGLIAAALFLALIGWARADVPTAADGFLIW